MQNHMGLTLPNGKRVEAHLAVWIVAVIQTLCPDKLNQLGATVERMNQTAQNVPLVNPSKPIELVS